METSGRYVALCHLTRSNRKARTARSSGECNAEPHTGLQLARGQGFEQTTRRRSCFIAELANSLSPNSGIELLSSGLSMNAHTVIPVSLAVTSRAMGEPDRPCYSMRLMQPFLDVLRQHPALSGAPQEFPNELDQDDRIPITTAHALLQSAIERTCDPDLGLKAARQIRFGDVGALDYLVCSGRTVKEAIEVASRYVRLVNDALDVRLELSENSASVRLESRVSLPRAAVDFEMASMFQNYWRSWLPGCLSELGVLFAHPAPPDIREYERTFAPAALSFSAAFNGFVMSPAYLSVRLESADPKLHDIIRKHAEQVLATLPSVQSVTAEVQSLLAEELTGGEPSAAHIARRLGVSTRTLGRKLEREATTFKKLLSEVRKRLALEYVGSHDFGLSEVALLLGFSQTAAFHRAFRRWTGQTPLQYRRQRLR
jgi:AraC-like DNA-binding protein